MRKSLKTMFALFKSIDRLVKQTNVVRVLWINETMRLLHTDGLFASSEVCFDGVSMATLNKSVLLTNVKTRSLVNNSKRRGDKV